MDLQDNIRPLLWQEISNSYEAGSYKNAVLDAIRYLSKIIREKSGLDGDGASLIGQAFSGETPKLRINLMQTQSEKDEQKGFQQLLMGLYLAIRNPRTHENIEDEKTTADPIIYFINYALKVIDKAKPPFTLKDFLQRVFDKDFVERKDYAQEIVNEIPPNKRLETLIEVFRQKDDGEGKKLRFFVEEITCQLTEAEVEVFLDIVSQELDIVTHNPIIISIIQILPNHLWSKIKKTAKMRIENKLISSIKTGDINRSDFTIRDGALGAWASKILKDFSLKEELKSAIFSQITSTDPDRVYYAFRYFTSYLLELFPEEYERKKCIKAMRYVLEMNTPIFVDQLMNFVADCPDEWLEDIKNIFEDFTSTDNPDYYLRDGSPFLGNIQVSETDDMPF